jgi:MFS family permease
MRNVPKHVRTVREALRFSNARTDALCDITDSEWHELVEYWAYVRLMLPLRHVGGDALPVWVRDKIDANIADNTLRFERTQTSYREIARALHEGNAEYVVLKGFSQWPAYMQNPRFRAQSDIDVYCPPESIDRARDIFLGLGYEPETGQEHRPNDHLPNMRRKSNWRWRGNHFDPEIPVSIDLHFRFWNPELMRLNPTGLGHFWSRRVERHLDDLSFPALDQVDSLGYGTLHMLRNLLLGGLQPYYAYEVAWFLHTNANDKNFWSRWRELHDDSLRFLEAVCFHLSRNWFGCQLPEQVEEEIRSLPAPVHHWFQTYGDSPLADLAAPNKDVLWLHLSLLESASDKRAVLRQRLLPTPTPSVKTLAHWSPSVYRKVLRHAASRVTYHAQLIPSTLWQGARWWWSSAGFGRQFWTFYAASFFFDLGMYIFFMLFNLYLLACGHAEEFIGHVVSASAVGSMVGTIPAGLAAQRFGLRKTLLVCFGLLPIVLASRVLYVREFAQLGLAFLAGAVSTTYAVCISPALAQLTTRRNRALGFSVVFSFGIGEGAFASLLGGHLPGWLSRIRPLAHSTEITGIALLIASGIVGLALWPTSRLKFTAPEPEVVPEQAKKPYRLNPFLLRFLPALAVWSLVTGGFAPFANVYFTHYLRMPVERMGTVFSASQLSQVIAILLSPLIFRKFGLVAGIMYTQIATALALFGLATAQGAGAAGLVYVGFMAVQFMNEPGMCNLLMNEVSPAERSSASAWNFLVISASQAIAAVAAGHAFARYGYPLVICITAGLGLLAAFLFQRLLRNQVSDEFPQMNPTRRLAVQRQ